jgi:hypothetical protein
MIRQSYVIEREISFMKKLAIGFVIGVWIGASVLYVLPRFNQWRHDRSEWIRVNRENLPIKWQMIFDKRGLGIGGTNHILDESTKYKQSLPLLTRQQAYFLAEAGDFISVHDGKYYFEMAGWIKE